MKYMFYVTEEHCVQRVAFEYNKLNVELLSEDRY